jgi:LmbE family N-acetylglucosaminyl deacetylase
MLKKILVIAPHPDDETIGCGGTLLRHIDNEDEVSFLLITKLSKKNGWKSNLIHEKNKEIKKVENFYRFKNSFKLNFPATGLDVTPISEIIKKISDIIFKIEPNIIYTNYNNDVHTDHQIVSKAVSSCLKWFRHPSIEKALMYETLSETNFNFESKTSFTPNKFINISKYLEKKIKVMNIYKTEIGKHPFPRGEEAIRANAILRGSQCGFEYAEAFKIIFEKE